MMGNVSLAAFKRQLADALDCVIDDALDDAPRLEHPNHLIAKVQRLILTFQT